MTINCRVISDSPNFEHHWIQSIADSLNAVYRSDEDLTLMIGHHDFNQSRWCRSEQIQTVMNLSSQCDLVFVFDTEIHQDHWTLDQQSLPANVFFLGPGRANGQWLPWLSFYSDLQRAYQQVSQVFENLTPWSVKSYAFDALLGMIKPHRTWVANRIIEDKMQSQIWLRYDHTLNNDWMSQGWIWPEGVEILPNDTSSPSHFDVIYHGVRIMENTNTPKNGVAWCLPISVYNKTCYTIVTETNWNASVHMITEKSARCILARRLFVVFTGPGYLEYLRSNGFQTFSHVIDESYDTIEDDQARWQAAWQQVRWLCDQPQERILEQARPAIEHNFQRMLNCNFREETKKHMHQVIQKTILAKRNRV